MMPSVPPPSGKVRTPVDLKLKAGWRFDTGRRVFVSDKGEEFAPRADLPKNSRVVYKAPGLSASKKTLTRDEQNLSRHMQVILPKDEAASDYVKAIREWPCVDEAQVPPQISLPKV